MTHDGRVRQVSEHVGIFRVDMKSQNEIWLQYTFNVLKKVTKYAICFVALATFTFVKSTSGMQMFPETQLHVDLHVWCSIE
jgi:hypothetical protein